MTKPVSERVIAYTRRQAARGFVQVSLRLPARMRGKARSLARSMRAEHRIPEGAPPMGPQAGIATARRSRDDLDPEALVLVKLWVPRHRVEELRFLLTDAHF